jgi:hypothetical protein
MNIKHKILAWSLIFDVEDFWRIPNKMLNNYCPNEHLDYVLEQNFLEQNLPASGTGHMTRANM